MFSVIGRTIGSLALVLLAALVLLWQWAAEHPVWALFAAIAVPAYVWYAIHLDRIKRAERLTDSHVPDMSPLEYEQFVARLLAQAGWRVEHVGRQGDQGADVVAELRGSRLVVQVKLLRRSKCGNSAIQEVTAARRHYGSQVMAVVAPNGFTKAARELARSNGVHLLHHTGLAGLERLARVPA